MIAAARRRRSGARVRKTWAGGINAAGHIVGTYNPPSGPRGSGFLYINGFYAANIDYPSADYTSPTGINNNGQIVGSYIKDSRAYGFLLSGGTYTTIDYPSASLTSPSGINDNGQIVGSYVDSSITHRFGFLYDPNGTYTTIDYPAATGSSALGINNNGQIVGGYSSGSGGHGYLYNPDGTYTTIDFP